MPEMLITSQSFKQFLFRDKRNRRILVISAFAVLLQFTIFKYFYPFADFFSDSYSYIYAASANLAVSIWPIGYSKFLSAFHTLTHSDTAVVAFQYFFLELSSMYFYFSILFFYNPGRVTRNILYIFLFFNPLFLYLSNYINSDPLFASLSIIWFSQLLWIINKPRINQIIIQATLLFLCFTVRNNAYYYPFIAVLAFLLSRQQIWMKFVGILLPIAFIVPFIAYTRNEAEKMTGKQQFSLFTGWQLANNSLYMYGHIKVDTSSFPSTESRELNRLSQRFYSRMPDNIDQILSEYVANFFIRQPQSPLKVFFQSHYQPKSDLEDVIDWGKASIIYSDFGKTLIEKHPIKYLHYFVILNTKNYFIPPLEKLEIYNLGEDEVSYQAQDWFDYKTASVRAVSKYIQGDILFIFPYLFLFLNVLSIGSILWWLLTKKQNRPPKTLNRTILLAAAFSACNFLFCITATIIVLRYEFFPMIILVSFPLLLIEWLDKKETAAKHTGDNPIQQSPGMGLSGLQLTKN